MYYGSEMRKTRRCKCQGHPKLNKGKGDQKKPGDERQRGRVICLDGQAEGQQKTLPETKQCGKILTLFDEERRG